MKKLTLVVFSVFVASLSAAADWLHYGNDNHYSSCMSAETIITKDNIGQLERIWGIGCDDGMFSVISRSPAIVNGLLYSSGAGMGLLAFDAKTGDLEWSFGEGNLGWANQPTASSDGKAFYLEGISGLYTMYAVNSQTGQEIWHSPIQFNLGYTDASIITVDETRDRVYMVEDTFAPEEGKLYALNRQTGAIEWYKSKQTDQVAFEGDFVMLEGDYLYADVSVEEDYIIHDKLVAINLDTLQIENIFPRPSVEYQRSIHRIIFCGDYVAATYSNGESAEEDPSMLVVYRVATTEILWTKTLSHALTGNLAFNPETETIYVPTNPYLFAYDILTGDEKWKHLGYAAIYNPTVANGIVYFLSETNMYALNESTGAKILTFPLGYEAYAESQVAICDGMLYFSGNGGTCDLFALGFPAPCTQPGAEITMPAHYFTPFDPCSCKVTLCNPDSQTHSGIPLFVILDIAGSLYFAPSFGSFDHYTVNLTPQWSEQIVFDEFEWPPTAGEASGIRWYAAMTDPAITTLYGSMSTWEFGWGYY